MVVSFFSRGIHKRSINLPSTRPRRQDSFPRSTKLEFSPLNPARKICIARLKFSPYNKPWLSKSRIHRGESPQRDSVPALLILSGTCQLSIQSYPRTNHQTIDWFLLGALRR
ncbi:unnamed protein product [Periconia digitata]|uniref:Uncharacterized protein n=1 Tax=Periconia digitata TaxID=1303443 RepID=A0A9W4UUS6_9PLEO|nr:unnamed protein product [Periconia digitata]